MKKPSLHTPVHIVNVRRHPRRLTFLLLFFLAPAMLAQGQWIANTSAQITQGSYYFGQTASTFSFIPGVRYQTSTWSIDLSVPYLIQNSDLVNSTGSMFFPTGEGHHQQESNRPGGSHHGGMADAGGQSWDSGIGDMLVLFSKTLFREQDYSPSVAVTAQLKVPTAYRGLNYGTGEFDYGAGLSLSKKYGTLAAFLDLGYLIIGDPEGITYLDPVMAGAGIGKFFQHGKYSVLFYYQTYSKIIEAYEAPQQISAMLSMKFGKAQYLSINVLRGLSETSPDFSVTLGLQQNL